MLTLHGLDHLVLRSNNAQQLSEFYCNKLGCTLERELAEANLIQLRAGASLIDIQQIPSHQASHPATHNLDHFCLEIAPCDLKALKVKLQSQGIVCEEIAERYGASGFGLSLYIRDMDGNRVELKPKKQAS
ncbi:VOC family protein [Dongshaea marina]|uniref:VOC family protein n=1 Tax=Dongshaea marina TaxID=2047966 RepID=UPI000D3E6531|nr:VOC family protein [Dongshaea marina]